MTNVNHPIATPAPGVLDESESIELTTPAAGVPDKSENIELATATSEAGQNLFERILSESRSLTIDLPETIGELKSWLIKRESDLAREAAKQGFGFLALKSQIKTGEFKGWLQENNLSEQRVYELISIANMLLNIPEKDRKRLMGVGKSKLIELARIAPDDMEEISESGELDELIVKPAKELRNEVRALKAKLAQTETEKNTQEKKQEKLEALLDLRREDTGYPDFYLVAREESRALMQQCHLCLDDFQALSSENLETFRTLDLSDSARHFSQQAMATLYCQLNGTVGRFVAALRELERHLPMEMIQQMQSDLAYSNQEVELAIQRYDAMLAKHQIEAKARADAREAAKHRGPGRPKKNTKA